MKSVLISIRPKWVEKIANGQKTIEVRKSAPKEVPFKAYIYCSKEKKQDDIIWAGAFGDRGKWNGHVIGEFICDKVFLLRPYSYDGGNADLERRKFIETFERPSKNIEILSATCLSQDEMFDYIGEGNYGYGWQISDLKIYDKPKELSDFCISCKTNCEDCKKPIFYDCWKEKGKIKVVTRPPQSWQYVEEI